MGLEGSVIESVGKFKAGNSKDLPTDSQVMITLRTEGLIPLRSSGIQGPNLLGRPSLVMPMLKLRSLGLSGLPLSHLVKARRSSFKYARPPRVPLVWSNFITKFKYSVLNERAKGTKSLGSSLSIRNLIEILHFCIIWVVSFI